MEGISPRPVKMSAYQTPGYFVIRILSSSLSLLAAEFKDMFAWLTTVYSKGYIINVI